MRQRPVLQKGALAGSPEGLHVRISTGEFAPWCKAAQACCSARADGDDTAITEAQLVAGAMALNLMKGANAHALRHAVALASQAER